MHEAPFAEALAEAARRALDAATRPDADARARFLGKVATNALALCARDAALRPAATARAVAAMSALLGRSGDFADLNALLCAEIAAGRIDRSTPGLTAALRSMALDQIAIDQPGWRLETADRLDAEAIR